MGFRPVSNNASFGQSAQASKVFFELDPNNLRDIDRMFQQLPKQLDQSKIWIRFWKRNAKPLVNAAKQNADSLGGTGQLAKSIGVFTTKNSRKMNGIFVGPRVKGRFAKKNKEYKGKNKKKRYSRSGFYGAYVEYGSEVKFGGKDYGKDQPFMMNAWNSQSAIVMANSTKDAIKTFNQALKSHERRLKKYGVLGY